MSEEDSRQYATEAAKSTRKFKKKKLIRLLEAEVDRLEAEVDRLDILNTQWNLEVNRLRASQTSPRIARELSDRQVYDRIVRQLRTEQYDEDLEKFLREKARRILDAINTNPKP